MRPVFAVTTDTAVTTYLKIVRPMAVAAVLLGMVFLNACAGGDDAPVVVPGISVQPASVSVTVGQSATFTVTVTGTPPFTYQWFRGSSPISGATAASYTTPITVLSDDGAVFKVTVTNVKGSVSSAGATLTVRDSVPVAASLAPSSATPPYNAQVALVPTFSGGTAVVGSSGAGSSDITSAAVSGHSYTTPSLTADKTYTLTVTSPGGQVDSITADVSPTDVTITAISPAATTMGPGSKSFSATASGGATNDLTWSATGGSFSGNTWTSPDTSGAYTITATSVDNPSVAVSTTATVSAPIFTAQPASQNVCAGGSTALSVTADYATTYQWVLDSVAISGANGLSYSIPAAAPADAGVYSVTATNPAGSTVSNNARIVVGSSITSNPRSLSLFSTQTATFSVAAAGQSPFTYQWYVIPSIAGPHVGLVGTLIPGATSSSYTTPAVDVGYDGFQYYATVTDACEAALTSAAATLTVATGNVPPTITTQPLGQAVPLGGAPSFSVGASGTPPLAYQWFRIPAGQTAGWFIEGANSSTYDVPVSDVAAGNDQDEYYALVSNDFGQAVSQHAPLVVGDGILVQITGQPSTAYVNEGAPASFTVAATSLQPLSYQWYKALPGSSTFSAIEGADQSTYTQSSSTVEDSGSVFYVVVSNGSTSPVSSKTASLFVGPLNGVNPLCDENWIAMGDAIAHPGCTFQLTAADFGEHGEIVWPALISTGNIQLSFTVTISDPSDPPADGFAMVLGDPSLGATPDSIGETGWGLGALGIPGFVLGFDTYLNEGDPPIPYLGVGRGELDLWENPWFNVNTNIAPLVSYEGPISHAYVVSIVQGQMTVTMDGVQVFSGGVEVPPVAYLYLTASTGGSFEQTVISDLSAIVSAASN